MIVMVDITSVDGESVELVFDIMHQVEGTDKLYCTLDQNQIAEKLGNLKFT